MVGIWPNCPRLEVLAPEVLEVLASERVISGPEMRPEKVKNSFGEKK